MTTFTEESARTFFDHYFSLLNEHDVRHIPALYTEDIEFEDDALPEIVRGHAGMEQVFTWLWGAVPDMRFTLLEGPFVAADGRHIAARVRISGTMTGALNPPGFAATGMPLTMELGGFYELQGERVKRARVILDMSRVAVQLGAAPPPGSRGEKLAVAMQRMTARRMRRRARGVARGPSATA